MRSSFRTPRSPITKASDIRRSWRTRSASTPSFSPSPPHGDAGRIGAGGARAAGTDVYRPRSVPVRRTADGRDDHDRTAEGHDVGRVAGDLQGRRLVEAGGDERQGSAF